MSELANAREEDEEESDNDLNDPIEADDCEEEDVDEPEEAQAVTPLTTENANAQNAASANQNSCTLRELLKDAGMDPEDFEALGGDTEDLDARLSEKACAALAKLIETLNEMLNARPPAFTGPRFLGPPR